MNKPPITLLNHYDRRKQKETLHFRNITLAEVPTLRHGQEVWCEALNHPGEAIRVRVASKVQTWKRNPSRFAVSFKYGLYETARMETEEILRRILLAY